MEMKHSMNNPFRMEIVQTVEDLFREGLRHVLVETTVLSQNTGDRTTRNVFEEAVITPLVVRLW